MEALRKAIGYQAKKAGLSSLEWKAENPDLLKVIQDTYNSKLLQLKEQEQLANPSGKAPMAVLSYVDGDNEETITGTVTPLQAAKIKPIEEYGFKGKKEPRLYTGTADFEAYLQECQESSIELTENQKNAVESYTYDAYEALNAYFLSKDLSDVFHEDAHEGDEKWNSNYRKWFSSFYNEDDLIDYAQELDGVLSKRNDEHQILYRGMCFYPEGEGMKIGEKRVEVESTYSIGNEIIFDSYSSTSVVPEVASTFSRMSFNNDNMLGVQYEIMTNAGVSVAHLSGNDDEREVILPRGIRYKVVNSYWDEGDYQFESIYFGGQEMQKNRNMNLMVVQLVEVDEQGNEVTGADDYVAPNIRG